MKTLHLSLAPWLLVTCLATVSCKDDKAADQARQQARTEAALEKTKAEAFSLRQQVKAAELQKKEAERKQKVGEQRLEGLRQKLEQEKTELAASKAALKAQLPSPSPATSSSAVPTPAAATGQDFFYEPLLAHGDWFQTVDYGYVWQPNVAAKSKHWQPYTVGRWLESEQGWTWYSDEPFGWATYHYGRWAQCHQQGWVWVPGNVWAPAWVSFRRSEKCVGWAPLPPETMYVSHLGPKVDTEYGLRPQHYCFVPIQAFCETIAPHLHPADQDDGHFHATKNVCLVTVQAGQVKCQGMSSDWVMRYTGQSVEKCKLQVAQPTVNATPQLCQPTLQGGKLVVQQLQLQNACLNASLPPAELKQKTRQLGLQLEHPAQRPSGHTAFVRARAQALVEAQAPAKAPPSVASAFQPQQLPHAVPVHGNKFAQNAQMDPAPFVPQGLPSPLQLLEANANREKAVAMHRASQVEAAKERQNQDARKTDTTEVPREQEPTFQADPNENATLALAQQQKELAMQQQAQENQVMAERERQETAARQQAEATERMAAALAENQRREAEAQQKAAAAEAQQKAEAARQAGDAQRKAEEQKAKEAAQVLGAGLLGGKGGK